MILVFPDAATLRLAFTSGVVPPEVAAAPAAVSFDAGRVAVETDTKLQKKAADELKRLGVIVSRKHFTDPQTVTCWPQAVSVEKGPEPSPGSAVLFELPAAEFASFAAEMLRLGNDRQSFRWVGDGDETRALLKVVAPPHYTLLRALDRAAGSVVRAYAEQTPRVWVELGFAHPLANCIAPPAGRLLFVRPPREWAFVEDTPFRDVYEAVEFALPAAPAALRNSPLESKFTVPLNLAPGNAADAPELWVLRGPAADGLDRFVRDADDRTLGRLRFAVGTDPAGGRIIVLRTGTTKDAPPVLALDGAVGYKPYWKLPNLYVPAGRRLHPPLRRDVVRKLLADDADRCVWLAPGAGGAFTPESMAEDSFLPLADWVEYVVETAHAPLAAWVDASRFAFENFICVETAPPKPRDDRGRPKVRPSAKESVAEPPTTSAPAAPSEPPTVVESLPELPAVKPPGEWAVRRQKLEDTFLAHDGPLDSPERRALWPELAAANAGAGDHAEAGICWANALWDRPTPPAGWLDTWVRAELPNLPRPVPMAEFDKRMAAADPTPSEVRQFAAVLLAAAHQPTPPSWFRERLPAVQRYLDANEAKLPVRLMWLTAYRLAQLGGADVLGLARVRDRLLQRLLEDGLNPERNLPHFLRFAGSKDAAQARAVRDGALELRQLVRDWTAKGLELKPDNPAAALAKSDNGITLAYIDQLFAFVLAKVGDEEASRELLESARRVVEAIPATDPAGTGAVARFLGAAYCYRVEQALAGRPHGGPLPPELQAEADLFRKKSASTAGQTNPLGTAFYSLERLWEQSAVLDPLEKKDPYADTKSKGDPLSAAMVALIGVREPGAFIRRARDLYRNGVDGKQTPARRFTVMQQLLPIAGRGGEAFAVEVVGLVPATLKDQPVSTAPVHDARDLGKLIASALALAANFDRGDLVRMVVDEFTKLVRERPGDQRYELVNAAAGPGLRTLRRLGFLDDVDRLLRRLQDEILNGKTPEQLSAKVAGKPETWVRLLQSLLHLAGGWRAFGLNAQADPVLAQAAAELTARPGSKVLPLDYARLVQAYVEAVGQGRADDGLARLAALFRAMPPERVPNTFSSSAYYSRLHLSAAEAVVLALISDDFALGTDGRRWLDEDESLIRRRVHRDVRQALDRGGL